MRSVWRRGLGAVVTVAVATAFTATGIGIWRDERDLQLHGYRAQVVVLSRHDERKNADSVRVRMPDGSVTTIDTYGPGEPGQTVEVVYWPDDPGNAEFPGWPTAVAVIDVVLCAIADLIALAILYGLVVPPLRRRWKASRKT
jgi:hypothetical protein